MKRSLTAVLLAIIFSFNIVAEGGENPMSNKPVATVNGVPVYSNKSMHSIVGSVITFSDGSWCDVSNGDVVNKGSGYISMNTPTKGGNSEKTVTDTKEYAATMLNIQGVAANVDVRPTNGDKMTVSMEGLKSAIDDVDVRLRGDTLCIEGKQDDGVSIRGSNVVVTGGGAFVGGSISIGGRIRGGRITTGRNTVIMSDNGGESDVKITVNVPKGSGVNVSGVQGIVNIGDTEGMLHASVLGGDDIRAGKVRDASLAVQGSGDITVNEVNGTLSMNVQGSGDIRVRDGSVSALNINIMGSGDARFNGDAVNANLTIMGSGDIDVAHVQNKPIKSIMGHGDINVGNW